MFIRKKTRHANTIFCFPINWCVRKSRWRIWSQLSLKDRNLNTRKTAANYRWTKLLLRTSSLSNCIFPCYWSERCFSGQHELSEYSLESIWATFRQRRWLKRIQPKKKSAEKEMRKNETKITNRSDFVTFTCNIYFVTYIFVIYIL